MACQVKVVLEELGLQYTARPMDLGKKEQKEQACQGLLSACYAAPTQQHTQLQSDDEGIPVSIAISYHLSDCVQWFLDINPNGRVPALVDHTKGDECVWETGSIMFYLCEQHGSDMLPKVGLSAEAFWLYAAYTAGTCCGRAVAGCKITAPIKIVFACRSQ